MIVNCSKRKQYLSQTVNIILSRIQYSRSNFVHPHDTGSEVMIEIMREFLKNMKQ